ncbi:hypothetical protein [Arthrobacter sp. MAHUQ-56]
MGEAENEQLAVRPADAVDHAANKPAVEVIKTRTYREIAERYLNGHKAKDDVEAGHLGLTFAEATSVMASDLAEFFHAHGKLHGIDTLLPGEISNEAVLGIPGENGKRIYPVNVAFGMTLGKIRARQIRAGINEAVSRMASRRDAEGQRRLRSQMTDYKDKTNFTKVGAGNTYTIATAIKHATDRIALASDRGGSPALAPDTLDRSAACKAAEERTAGPQRAAIRAASLPAEISHGDHLETTGTLDMLLHWGNSIEHGEAPDMNDVLALAKQCAQMNYLSDAQLDLLSSDVARRIHSPFGLLDPTGHAGMVAGLYLYSGEAPYEVLKLASAYMDASAADQYLVTGNFAALINNAQSHLEKAIRNSRVRWTGKITVSPTAVDIIRLLAAIAGREADELIWPDGLLEEVLRGYDVGPEDIPGAVNLLKATFSVHRSHPGVDEWWSPSVKWNTIGCRILERIATFDHLMSGEDREDLKVKASRSLPLERLSELRDNLIRAESDFPQTVREEEDGTIISRSTFAYKSLIGANKWLWQFGRQKAVNFLTATKREKETAHLFVRGMTDHPSGATSRIPSIPNRRPQVQFESPRDWVSIATSKEAVRALMEKGAKPTLGPGPRTTEDVLLDILIRAENFPHTRPRQNQSITGWITERVDELNLLEEDMDDLIDLLYQGEELSTLLEAIVRGLKEEETGR